MAVRVISGQAVGLTGRLVDVEADTSPGLHKFTIVGLPDKAVEESRDRIAAAIKNTGLKSPDKSNLRVTINLAPADLKKEGPLFDFPIALAYLLATRQTVFDTSGKCFIGELALDGSLRIAKGVLPIALHAASHGARELFVPKGNGKEASYATELAVFEIGSLGDALDHLEERARILQTPTPEFNPKTEETPHDFADIRGQETAKRASEIAASGMHHLAFTGPPGTGKTLLARAIASILPPLTLEEALEITSIHSVAGTAGATESGLTETRPFRSPHHTASYPALVGGGTVPKPGEITLAHRGVLFLDEFPEFDRAVIEALREPLEEGMISISRVRGASAFPARILMVAAMNLCPCGKRGTAQMCVCAPSHLARYARRISGPIVDRIDLWAAVPALAIEKLDNGERGEPSTTIAERVRAARERQHARYNGTSIRANSELSAKNLETYAPLSDACRDILRKASKELGLSARSYHRVIKVARTIADLEGADNIETSHVLEALQYRPRMDFGL